MNPLKSKETIYMLGALASIVALYLIFKKRDAIVQAPSIGRVVTQPSGSTDAQLGYQTTLANIAGALAGKEIDAKTQTTISGNALLSQQAQLSSAQALQGASLSSGLELARINQGAQTDRARIAAEASANVNGASYAAELARINAQAGTAAAGQAAQNRRDLLSAIGQGISSLASLLKANQAAAAKAGGASGGASGGAGSTGTAARRSNPFYNVPTPRGVSPQISNGLFSPQFPWFGVDPNFMDFGFDNNFAFDYVPPNSGSGAASNPYTNAGNYSTGYFDPGFYGYDSVSNLLNDYGYESLQDFINDYEG